VKHYGSVTHTLHRWLYNTTHALSIPDDCG